MFRPLDDLGLCPVGAAMLERDLIRQRDWEYAASTALLNDEEREAMRQQVAAEYGEGLELIAPSGAAKRLSKLKRYRPCLSTTIRSTPSMRCWAGNGRSPNGR